MQDNTLKKLIMIGLMIALVFLATYFTRIPTMVLPGGYFNLGDAVIILASVLLGPAGGLAEAFLLGMFDEAFGLTAAVAELLPNTLQGIFSAVLGYILVLVFSKINLDRPAGR